MSSEPKKFKHSNLVDQVLYQLDCSQCEIRASNEQHKECRQIMSKVPQFWRTTFKNHPDLNPLLEGPDKDCFNFLTEIDVEYFKGERLSYQLKFHFMPNPYFENDVLVKEISGGMSGDAAESSSIPIKWKKGEDLANSSLTKSNTGHKRELDQYSFLTWYNDHSDPISFDINDAICYDLWDTLLPHFCSSYEDKCSVSNEEESQPVDSSEE